MDKKIVKLAAVTFCIMLLLVSPIQAGLIFNRDSGTESNTFKFIYRDRTEPESVDPINKNTLSSNIPPEVYIITANNTLTLDSTPVIKYYFLDSDDSTADVTLYVDGQPAGSKLNVPSGSAYKYISPSSSLTQGAHNFYLKVSDGDSTVTSTERTITYYKRTKNEMQDKDSIVTSNKHNIESPQPPVITLYEPADGEGITSKPVTHVYSVNDPDDSYVSCHIWYNSTTMDSRSVIADGSQISVDLSPDDGFYDWHVRCNDGSNFISSSHRDLTIDTVPPNNVSNLRETSVTSSSIRWEWTDPTDDDLDHIEIWLDGVFQENVSAGTEYYDATGLAPNTEYTIYTYPVDEAGNRGSLIYDQATTDEDTSDPVITYNPNTDESGSYAKNWIMINVTVDEPHLQTLNLIWNGSSESFDNSDGNVYWENKAGLSDGTYTFNVYAEDTSGHSVYAGERTVTLDSTPPPVVSNLHEVTTTSDRIDWEWTNPSVSDFDHVEVYLNGTFMQNTSNEYFNATGLTPETLYELSVRPVDTAGNIGAFETDEAETLSVDSLPSFNFVRISPSSPNENDDLICEFQFQDADDSSLPADITWYVDGVQDNSWNNSITANNNTLETSAGPTSSDTSPGETYECEVTLDDRDADVTLMSSAVTISEIVNTPPGVYLVTPDNEYTNDVTPGIEYYFIDNENQTADATLYFDGSSVNTMYNVQNGTSTKTISASPQSEGSHTYYIEVDDGEAVASSATQTITIDVTDPTISYNANTDASGTYDKNWINIGVSASDDLSLSTPLNLEWNGVNESSWDVCSTGGGGSSISCEINKTSLPYGTYTFKAYAEDEAGNVVSTSERTVTLEEAHSLPAFDFVRIDPANPETDDDLICEFQYTDAENTTLDADIRWYRDGSWVNTWDNSITANNNTLETSAGPTSAQTSDGQSWECEVTLHDIDGDVTLMSSPAVVGDYTGPGAVTGLDETSTGENWIYWEWTNPSDSDFDHSEVSIDGSAPVSVGTDEYFNATGFTAGTIHEINVTTYDTSTNEGGSAQDTATTDAVNTAPTIILISPDDGNKTNDNTPRHYFNATDNEQSTLMCSLHYSTLGELDTRSVSNNTIEYTVPSSGVPDGTYDWWIECNDTQNVVSSSTRTIEIDTTLPANNDPVVQSVDVLPNSPGSDEDLSCEFLATDAENTTLYADITWYRDGVNVNTWDVSGMAITNNTLETAPNAPTYTDTATGEEWTCEVTVSDEPGASDSLNGSETIQSAVGPGGNTLPTVYVTTANNTVFTTSTPTIDFRFTDPEDARGDATVYFNGTIVGTMADVANNTPASITTSALSDGVYDVRVDVFDGAGTNSSETYTLIIDAVPPYPYANLYFNNNTDGDGEAYSKDWIMINATAKDPNYTSVTLDFCGLNMSFDHENESGNNWYWQNFTGMPEGTYTFRAYAESPSGTDRTEERTVTLDTTAPNVTNMTTDPENVTNDGNEQDINVSFNSSEYPLEITFNLYDSGNNLEDTQGPTTVNDSSELPITYTIPAGLDDGTYALNMTAVDNAGNSVTVTVMTFVVSTGGNGGTSGGGGGGGGSLPSGNINAILTVTPEEEEEGHKPNPDVAVGSDFSGITVQEGQTRTLIFTVENSGDVRDVYTIYTEGTTGWATVDKKRISLEPGESAEIILIFKPQVGDAGDYVVRAIADSQNEPVSSTWDYDVRVTPAGVVTAFITFAGGRFGAALLGLAFLAVLAAVFWRAASEESRERVRSKFRFAEEQDKNSRTKKKVEEEKDFLDTVVKSVGTTGKSAKTAKLPEMTHAPRTEPLPKFDFKQRSDKYIWEV